VIDDMRVRMNALEWLEEQVALHGDVLPRKLLEAGFTLDDERVPLLGASGIFKPRVLSGVPLSITTSPNSPYDDAFGSDGLLRYRYRGTDPGHYQNRSLRDAMRRRLPLVYFHGIVPGRYLATWPVFVVADDPRALEVTVAVDDARSGLHLLQSHAGLQVAEDADLARRAYITSSVRVRLHQRAFRERVLEAYQRQCAFCHFRHEEMLDAAHIVPDSHPHGEPVVTNGLALCALHHAAFDRQFLGLRPDYTIEVRPDLLREKDGPTLAGIQGLHGQRILLPGRVAQRPDPTLVAMRYEQFREAC